MKFIIQKQVLTKLIESVYPVVETKKTTSLPAHKCIKITAAGGTVSLAADNGQCYVESTHATDVESEGICGISGKVFANLVKTLPDMVITFCSSDNTLKITAARKTATLNTVSGDIFPIRWRPEFNSYSYYETDGLVDAMKQVAFAASNDETRMAIQNIYLNHNHIVATDGHRLALVEMPKAIEGDYKIHKELIERFKKQLDGKMLIAKQDKQVLIINGETRYILSEAAQEYPSYRKIIPTVNPNSITFKTADLKIALKNVDTMKEGKVFFKVVLEISDNGCTITCTDSGVGQIVEQLDCVASCANLKIGFNVGYLLDAISPLKEENVTLKFQNPISPVIIVEKNLTQVVMPLRI